MCGTGSLDHGLCRVHGRMYNEYKRNFLLTIFAWSSIGVPLGAGTMGFALRLRYHRFRRSTSEGMPSGKKEHVVTLRLWIGFVILVANFAAQLRWRFRQLLAFPKHQELPRIEEVEMATSSFIASSEAVDVVEAPKI